MIVGDPGLAFRRPAGNENGAGCSAPGHAAARPAPATVAEAEGIVAGDFRPPWWLASPHLQTLWQTLCRVAPVPSLRRERLTLPDGDFLDLDWTEGREGEPVVLILHGLEGSSRSAYARGLLQAVRRRGWRGAVMHFRGCSGEPNRLERSYHSGETGDLEHVVTTLRAREPATALAAVGFSLGGNVLLKWLGERGAGTPLRAAVAVSVPFVLALCAERLESGFSRFYQWWLIRSLRRRLYRKFAAHPAPPFPLGQMPRWRTFRVFDDRVTAPLHGFRDADDYYRRASSRPFLPAIRVPTLIVQARDDPFVHPQALPHPGELSPTTRLELSERGGHVGFVAGGAGRPRYWLEARIPAYLAGYLG